MAVNSTQNYLGVVDKRKLPSTGTLPGNLADTRYSSVTAMRTRLAAINAGYFTSVRLDSMSDNDMLSAIRQADDAAGI